MGESDLPRDTAARVARRACLLLALCSLAAAPSWARSRDRLPYIGARVGYLRVEDVDSGSLNVGLLYGVLFAPRVSLEASVDYHTPNYDNYSRSTYAFQASLYVHAFNARHAFRPYAVGGVGFYWNYYDPDDNFLLAEDSRSDAGYHAGFGFDVTLGGRPDPNDPAPVDRVPLSLTVDFRYLFTQDDPGGTESDGILATVGLKYGF